MANNVDKTIARVAKGIYTSSDEEASVDSIDDSDMSFEKENPMFNSLILFEVFKNLNIYDLKRCRKVCRTWYECSVLNLRNCAAVRIQNENGLNKLKGIYGMAGLQGLGNYKLNLCTAGNIILSKFLAFPVPLLLLDVTINFSVLTDEIVTFLSHFPLLESLTFISRPSSQYEALLFPKTQVTFEERPGLRFPRLKRIICVSILPHEIGKLYPVLLAATNLRELRTKRAINTHLWTKFDNWKDTLETLEVGYMNYEARMAMTEFPTLHQLKHLTASGQIVCPGRSKLPKLESAVFEDAVLEVLFPPGSESTNLTSLQLERPYIQRWKGFSELKFPCIKILIFPWMTNTLFRVVCTNLKTLEELHVGSTILDYSVTGVPRFRSGKLATVLGLAKEPGFKIKKFRKYTCISDLPNLTRLTICAPSSAIRLSEASLLLGIVYCKNLSYLKIALDISKISVETMGVMSNRMRKLETLVIQMPYRLRSEPGTESSFTLLKEALQNCSMKLLLT